LASRTLVGLNKGGDWFGCSVQASAKTVELPTVL
jgi:hypothetical protein